MSDACKNNVRVDGAWKRTHQGEITTEIGWIATQGNTIIFHGCERVMASSTLQADARTMLKGLLEADQRNIRDVKVMADYVQLVQAINTRQKLMDIHSIIVDIDKLCNEFDSCQDCKVTRKQVVRIVP